MSLAILFHFLRAQHISDINISIIRSLRLCCWITTSVVLFCKDGWSSVSVNLRCTVVCVWCDAFCRFVVVGRCILIDIDRHLLCFVIIVFVCVWYFSLVVNNALITKQPMKNTTHKRTQWSQSITDSGQYQLKYTYQLQQSDKTHHTKHTPLYTVNLH